MRGSTENMQGQYRDPSQKSKNRYHVDEVTENNFGVAANVHVSKEAEQSRDAKRINRNSAAIRMSKELGRFALRC